MIPGGNRPYNPTSCPDGYTASSSKPNCGKGKKAHQNGSVDGKGCYKCIDETSDDCSNNGKLEKDLTCESKTEVGSTPSGQICYKCDDICPIPYSIEKTCVSSSYYPAEVEGKTSPTGKPCYECLPCNGGEYYGETAPSSTQCYYYSNVEGTPCYEEHEKDYANSDDSCPAGMQLAACGVNQTETATGKSACDKTCYKCETDNSGEDEDNPYAKCPYDLGTLALSEHDDVFGNSYAAGPLNGRVFKLSEAGLRKEIIVGDEEYRDGLLEDVLELGGAEYVGYDCYDNATEECYIKMAQFIKEEIAEWVYDSTGTVFIEDAGNILNSKIKCEREDHYFDLYKYGVDSSRYPYWCDPMLFYAKSFGTVSGGYSSNYPYVPDLVLTDDYVIFPKGYILEGNKVDDIKFKCEGLRTQICPKGTNPVMGKSYCLKSGTSDTYGKICQCSVVEKENDCGYCECVRDVSGRHMGRVELLDSPWFELKTTKYFYNEEIEDYDIEEEGEAGEYYSCGCIRGTALYGGECICPANKKWDNDAQYYGHDDQEPNKNGKCVEKETNTITVTPYINVDTASVLCNRTDVGSTGSTITYQFPIREFKIEAVTEKAVTEATTVEAWVIDARYKETLVDHGSNPYDMFEAQNFNVSTPYKHVSCTIEKGGNICTSASERDFNVTVIADYVGTYVSDGHQYDTYVRCPAEDLSDTKFAPMLIPYVYAGVRSSADDIYKYTLVRGNLGYSWGDTPFGKNWFGNNLAQAMEDKRATYCPDGTWHSMLLCRSTGQQSDWGEGIWRNLMGIQTSAKDPMRAYLLDKGQVTWPISNLNRMPYSSTWPNTVW